MNKMMAIRFPIRGNVRQLVSVAVFTKGVHQPLGKVFPVREQVFKRDRARDRCIVKKYRDGVTG